MRVLRIKTRLKPVGTNQEIIVKNDMLIGDGEQIKNVLERLYTPDNFKIITFDFYELNLFVGKQVFDLGHIDMGVLSQQKAILINMIQAWGEADDQQQREDAQMMDGLVGLIETIQDYAVDKLGLPEKEVFPNLEEDAEEFADLFEEYESLPENVRTAIESFDADGNSYEECARVQKLVEKLGYTFDYGLDGEPYSLRKML